MGPAPILFSVFEVCCFFSGKNCVYLSSASFLSVITPLLHLCKMSLSREAMGYYWHSPLTRGTHTQTRMHTHMHAHKQILLSVISPCTLSKLQKHTSMCILQTHSTFTSVLKHLMFLSLITLFLNTLSAIIGRVGCDGEVKPELKA